MKGLLTRLTFLVLSDRQIMDLYVGLQLRFVTLKQQTIFTYWLEEATVAGMTHTHPNWHDWCQDQQRNSQLEYDRLVALRTLLMKARPKLFVNHKSKPLEGIDVKSKYFWETRPTFKAYRKIIEAQEPTPKGYKRPTK